jgi:lipocalin
MECLEIILQLYNTNKRLHLFPRCRSVNKRIQQIKNTPRQYQGTWYEVGKYPVPCAYSTDDYRYNSEGNYLNVLNTCYNE